MPKLKTHSGAKKRFNKTKTGKIKVAKAFKSHILTKKPTKRTRRLRQGGYADGRYYRHEQKKRSCKLHFLHLNQKS